MNSNLQSKIRYNFMLIIKFMICILMVFFLAYSFEGPKPIPKVYDEALGHMQENSYKFTGLKEMRCEGQEYSILNSVFNNFMNLKKGSIRCLVKFSDGKIISIVQNLKTNVNSALLNFGLSRKTSHNFMALFNGKFSENNDAANSTISKNLVNEYESYGGAQFDMKVVSNYDMAGLQSSELIGIISAAYNDASARHNAGQGMANIWE